MTKTVYKQKTEIFIHILFDRFMKLCVRLILFYILFVFGKTGRCAQASFPIPQLYRNGGRNTRRIYTRAGSTTHWSQKNGKIRSAMWFNCLCSPAAPEQLSLRATVTRGTWTRKSSLIMIMSSSSFL